MSQPMLDKVKALLATRDTPEPGPGPRAGVQAVEPLNDALEKIFAESKLSAENRELVRALVLLWHDHLDAAHAIAQNIESRDGSFVHGMMHRREMDFSNAKYWFRRAGPHPCVPQIAARVTAGEWEPFAFVDACEEAARKKDFSPPALRQVQQVETEVLLEFLLGE